MGLLSHWVFASQLLQEAGYAEQTAKIEELGKEPYILITTLVFETQSRKEFWSIQPHKRTFFLRHKLRLQFLWLPSTNVLWLKFSPNANHSEKVSKFVRGSYFVG